jgi:poly(hydroxyalkanoate) depolymerase family esterase
MALQSSMIEALRLTRAGRLEEATALLRGALSGNRSPSVPPWRTADPSVTPFPGTTVIDLVPRQVTARSICDHSEQPATSSAGRFESRRHDGAAGAIDYMLYSPSSAAPGMPLVVMLHGCTQSPEDFARGTRMNLLAEEFGFFVVYPRQSRAANPQKCWNWFRPGDQARDRGEPALIVGLVRDIVAAEQLDETRVYAAGLSAGGAAAAILAKVYPEVFAAVGIHSGLACGAARNLPSALAAMKQGAGRGLRQRSTNGRFVPVITFHGDSDTTVHEVNARDIVRDATAEAGVSTQLEIEKGKAGGRRYTRALSRDEAGRVMIEQWTIAGAGHAWSGGDATGSFTDATGPDASRAMLRFFLDHARP